MLIFQGKIFFFQFLKIYYLCSVQLFFFKKKFERGDCWFKNFNEYVMNMFPFCSFCVVGCQLICIFIFSSKFPEVNICHIIFHVEDSWQDFITSFPWPY